MFPPSTRNMQGPLHLFRQAINQGGSSEVFGAKALWKRSCQRKDLTGLKPHDNPISCTDEEHESDS